MKKKLLAVLLVAPLLLTACEPTSSDSGNSSQSTGDNPIVSNDSNSSNDSSNNDSGNTGGEDETTYSNYQRNGHVSVDLSFGGSTIAGFIADILPINYSSDISVAYTKNDSGAVQLYGDHANYQLSVYPNQGYAEPVEGDTEETLANKEMEAALNNIDALGTVFNLLPKVDGIISGINDSFIGQLIGGIDIDIPSTSSFPFYYRASSSHFADNASSVTSANIEEANYSDVFSVSLLNGTNGYFTDTTADKTASGIPAVRGYEEFNLGGSSEGGTDIGSIISTLLPLLGSLDIDLNNIDIIGLLGTVLSLLIVPNLPEDGWHFDIGDEPIASIVGNAVRILLDGLTIDAETRTDSNTLNSYVDLTLGFNEKGMRELFDYLFSLDALSSFADLISLPDTDPLDFSITLSFVKGQNSSNYNIGGLGLDISGKVIINPISILGAQPINLSAEVAFDPEETSLSDSYFTDLASDYAEYKNIHDEAYDVFTQTSAYVDYTGLDRVEGNIDLSDSTLPATLDNIQKAYDDLSADAKYMLPANLDVSKKYDEGIEAVNAIDGTETIDSVDSANEAFESVYDYQNWREAVKNNGKGGDTAIANLDNYINGQINAANGYLATISEAAAGATAALEQSNAVLEAYKNLSGLAFGFDSRLLTAEQAASIAAIDTEAAKTQAVEVVDSYFLTLTTVDDLYNYLQTITSYGIDAASLGEPLSSSEASNLRKTLNNALENPSVTTEIYNAMEGIGSTYATQEAWDSKASEFKTLLDKVDAVYKVYQGRYASSSSLTSKARTALEQANAYAKNYFANHADQTPDEGAGN